MAATPWAILSAFLYALWWPTSKLLLALAFVLSPFWAITQFLLLPVFYLAQGILAIVLFPFRLHILERIETIYIWLGVATLIGCCTGATLFVLSKLLFSALQIDGPAWPESPADGKTVKEYREARRAKKNKTLDDPTVPIALKMALPRMRGLSSQAILEEELEY